MTHATHGRGALALFFSPSKGSGLSSILHPKNADSEKNSRARKKTV